MVLKLYVNGSLGFKKIKMLFSFKKYTLLDTFYQLSKITEETKCLNEQVEL